MEKSIREFILKPSEILEAGVGCFSVNALERCLRLNPKQAYGGTRKLFQEEIPDPYLKYCVFLECGRYLAPSNFTAMSVFWYINHAKDPNLIYKDGRLLTARDIEPGEELTLYYPDLLTHPKNKLWVREEHI